MKKTNRGVIAAGLCLLVYFLNELLLLIGYLRMHYLLVSDAGLSAQVLEAANLSFAPTLISSAVRVLIYLLLVLYCFRLNQNMAGAWLFALAFLLEATRCGRMFVDNISNGFVNMDTVCLALMLVFCLAMALLKAVRSKLIWGLGGIALGIYLLLTIADAVADISIMLRNQPIASIPWWLQIVTWGLALCRIAGFFLLWRQERPVPPESTPE